VTSRATNGMHVARRSCGAPPVPAAPTPLRVVARDVRMGRYVEVARHLPITGGN
jgi:hypothetical protein